MVTKQHLIMDLLLICRGGAVANSESISEDQVSFWIDNTRARLIRNDIEKGHSLNPALVQSLGCVEIALVDQSECPCQVVGCSILRSVLPIPNAIEVYHNTLITRVGPVQISSLEYSVISFEQASWIGNNPYTKKITRAFFHNGYLYLISKNRAIKYINIQGVFEYPEDVANFTTCDGDVCYDENSDYPIANYMIEDLKKMILDTDFKIAVSSPTDKTGDQSHNVESNQIK